MLVSAFCSSTQTAVNALYADFKFKSYYNSLFQLDAVSSFVCHLLRAIYNLVCITLRLLATPYYLLSPLAWASIPEHMTKLLDNTLALGISLVTFAIHPLIFTVRTITSLIRGYEENTRYDQGVELEKEDLSTAITIF